MDRAGEDRSEVGKGRRRERETGERGEAEGCYRHGGIKGLFPQWMNDVADAVRQTGSATFFWCDGLRYGYETGGNRRTSLRVLVTLVIHRRDGRVICGRVM